MPAQPMTITSAPSLSRSRGRPRSCDRASSRRTRFRRRSCRAAARRRAGLEPHLPQIAHVPAHRAPAGSRGRRNVAAGSAVSTPHSLMPNTGLRRRLAADGETRVGVAGDDEGIRVVGLGSISGAAACHAVDVGLRLDAERAFGKRDAYDLRARPRSGTASSASSIPCVTSVVRVRIDDEDRGGACSRRCSGFLVCCSGVDYHCDWTKGMARRHRRWRKAYDCVIRGGRVATASDDFAADVAINGGTIAAIGRGLAGGQPRDRCAGQAGAAGRRRHPLPHRAAVGRGHDERRHLRERDGVGRFWRHHHGDLVRGPARRHATDAPSSTTTWRWPGRAPSSTTPST